MEARTRLLGGRLSVEGEPGKGTLVRVTVLIETVASVNPTSTSCFALFLAASSIKFSTYFDLFPWAIQVDQAG
jgi:hypothetical protein